MTQILNIYSPRRFYILTVIRQILQRDTGSTPSLGTGAHERTACVCGARTHSSSPISLCAASPLCERRRQPAGNVTLALPHRRVVHIMRRLLYAARATLLPASCRHPTTPTALLREPSASFSPSILLRRLVLVANYAGILRIGRETSIVVIC